MANGALEPVANESAIEHLRNALTLLEPTVVRWRDAGYDPAAVVDLQEVGELATNASLRMKLALRVLDKPAAAAGDRRPLLFSATMIDLVRQLSMASDAVAKCDFLGNGSHDEFAGEHAEYLKLSRVEERISSRIAAIVLDMAKQQGVL